MRRPLKPKSSNKNNTLYYVTATWLGIAALVGIYFLLQTTQPTSDIDPLPETTLYTLDVESVEPGETSTFILDDVPVIVWRRDFAQQIHALDLLGIDLSKHANALEELRARGEIELEAGRTLRVEWFVVGAINPGGYGCMVVPTIRDVGGFFDPCQEVLFDLWGRVSDGPTKDDLQVLPWRFSERNKWVFVDVAGAPKQK